MNLQTQPAPGNWSEVRIFYSEKSKLHFHNMQISDHRYLERVSKNLRKKLHLAEDAPVIGIEALKTNVLICGPLMSTTMKAAMHLGPHYVENLEVYKNTNFEELQNLFDITPKLMNVTTIDWTSPSWTRSTLTQDQVITWTKAKVRVYSDSVLCLGKMSDHSEANRRWKSSKKINSPSLARNYKELMENRFSSSEIFSQDLRHRIFSKRSRETWKIELLSLRILKIKSSACQCSMISNGQRKEIQNNVFQIPNKSRITRRDSREDNEHSTALGDEKKWYGTLSKTPERKWDSTATKMMERFKETGHPIFKSICALSRGILKRKNNRDTIHFNADASNTELLVRTTLSANQLSIYGAVSSWCEEFGQRPNERDDLRKVYDERKWANTEYSRKWSRKT